MLDVEPIEGPSCMEMLIAGVLILAAWVAVAMVINDWQPGMRAGNWIVITMAVIWTLFIAKEMSFRQEGRAERAKRDRP